MLFSLDRTFSQIYCKLLFNSGNRSVFARHHSAWLSLNRRAIVILAYDALLTFSREIDYIWRRKMSAASVIFILLRYCGLAANITALIAW